MATPTRVPLPTPTQSEVPHRPERESLSISLTQTLSASILITHSAQETISLTMVASQVLVPSAVLVASAMLISREVFTHSHFLSQSHGFVDSVVYVSDSATTLTRVGTVVDVWTVTQLATVIQLSTMVDVNSLAQVRSVVMVSSAVWTVTYVPREVPVFVTVVSKIVFGFNGSTTLEGTEVSAAVLIGGVTGAAAVMALVVGAVLFVVRKSRPEMEEGSCGLDAEEISAKRMVVNREEVEVDCVGDVERESQTTSESLDSKDLEPYLFRPRMEVCSDLDISGNLSGRNE
jgi:hypothetical protein